MEDALKINLVFHSHYNEPPLTFNFDVTGGNYKLLQCVCVKELQFPSSVKSVTVDLQYNPFTGEWAVSRSDEHDVEDIVQKLASATV